MRTFINKATSGTATQYWSKGVSQLFNIYFYEIRNKDGEHVGNKSDIEVEFSLNWVEKVEDKEIENTPTEELIEKYKKELVKEEITDENIEQLLTNIKYCQDPKQAVRNWLKWFKLI